MVFKIYLLSFLTNLFLCPSRLCSQSQEYSWAGFKASVNTGSYAVLQKIHDDDKIRLGPAFEMGLEYGLQFGSHNHWYFGSDILFNFFYPDSVEKKTITLLEEHEVYPIFIPIFDFMLGYSLDDRNQILFGSTYFWGLTLMYRSRISEEFYCSFKTVYWLDRVLFDLGLHDIYATLGLGYVFD